jgi:cytoskeletal protein CcmA (bactofilin family)
MRKGKKTGITTFIGPETVIDGTIRFHGVIRLDGTVRGRIEGEDDGVVIIGEQAEVDAEIRAETIVVMGKVTGFLAAAKKIEVYPPGNVRGDMQAPTISIDPGAIFDGACNAKAAPDDPERKTAADDTFGVVSNISAEGTEEKNL